MMHACCGMMLTIRVSMPGFCQNICFFIGMTWIIGLHSVYDYRKKEKKI